jgi:nicotinate-nucleotide adenylyltransferase
MGIFGGTFSPPHCAHLRVAQTALAQFGLSEVVFVPSGIPPHKGNGVIDKEHRFRMVERMVAGRRKLSVSRIEIDRAGPSYTIDTIRALMQTVECGLSFIVGADLLFDITTWREPEELLRSVPFVLAPRHGVTRAQFDRAPFHGAQLHFLEMEEVDLSSTWVRKRIACEAEYARWVPSAVVEYIEEHRLYRNRERAAVHPS